LFRYLFELQEATLKADGYGVGPIICLELFDDVPDMEIDCRFGNSQAWADLFVPIAISDQPQD
jgi:hypothetical protein